MIYGNIGTLCEGSLDSDDLLRAFAIELDELTRKNDTAEHESLIKEAWRLNESRDEGYKADIIAELQDALGEFSPPFCHFGAHEGDGADFGYWPNFDVIEEACRDGEAIKVSDLSEIPAGLTAGYVVLVNDHGNVSIFEPKVSWAEVWSCV